MRKRSAASPLVALYFIANCAAPHAAEANFWAERKKAVAGHEARITHHEPRPANQALLASLPGAARMLPGLAMGVPGVASDDVSVFPPTTNHEPPTTMSWVPRILPYGSVREIHLSKDPAAPVVVHVQDAHGIEEAQLNTAKIIDAVGREPRLLVFLEGAAGPVDPGPFRGWPDAEVTRGIAARFLKEGSIGGAEFAALTAPEPPVLWGVEDEALYLANVKAVGDARVLKPEVEKVLAALKAAIEPLKESLYSPELKEFDRRYQAHQEHREGLADYAKYLLRAGGREDFPNLTLLEKAFSAEAVLDFQAVERERLALVEALTRRLPRQALGSLVRRSLQYRAGEMGYGDYHRFLKSLCARNGISLDAFPRVKEYIAYVLLAEEIDRNELLDELRRAEREVQDRLAVTDGQRRLAAAGRRLALLEKLAAHEMTPADWSAYVQERADILNLPKELEESTTLPPSLLAPFEDFCRLAVARNDAIVGNLLSELSSRLSRPLDGPPLAVLVAGGFHTEGLTRLMRERGLSYVVAAPKITEVPARSDHLDVFARDPLPLDKLFQGERIFLREQVAMASRPFTPFQRIVLWVKLKLLLWQYVLQGRDAARLMENADAAGIRIEELRAKDGRVFLTAGGEPMTFTIKGTGRGATLTSLLPSAFEPLSAWMDGLREWAGERLPDRRDRALAAASAAAAVLWAAAILLPEPWRGLLGMAGVGMFAGVLTGGSRGDDEAAEAAKKWGFTLHPDGKVRGDDLKRLWRSIAMVVGNEALRQKDIIPFKTMVRARERGVARWEVVAGAWEKMASFLEERPLDARRAGVLEALSTLKDSSGDIARIAEGVGMHRARIYSVMKGGSLQFTRRQVIFLEHVLGLEEDAAGVREVLENFSPEDVAKVALAKETVAKRAAVDPGAVQAAERWGFTLHPDGKVRGADLEALERAIARVVENQALLQGEIFDTRGMNQVRDRLPTGWAVVAGAWEKMEPFLQERDLDERRTGVLAALSELRRAGETVASIAARAGLHPSSISKFMSGDEKLSRERTSSLEALLGLHAGSNHVRSAVDGEGSRHRSNGQRDEEGRRRPLPERSKLRGFPRQNPKEEFSFSRKELLRIFQKALRDVAPILDDVRGQLPGLTGKTGPLSFTLNLKNGETIPIFGAWNGSWLMWCAKKVHAPALIRAYPELNLVLREPAPGDESFPARAVNRKGRGPAQAPPSSSGGGVPSQGLPEMDQTTADNVLRALLSAAGFSARHAPPEAEGKESHFSGFMDRGVPLPIDLREQLVRGVAEWWREDRIVRLESEHPDIASCVRILKPWTARQSGGDVRQLYFALSRLNRFLRDREIQDLRDRGRRTGFLGAPPGAGVWMQERLQRWGLEGALWQIGLAEGAVTGAVLSLGVGLGASSAILAPPEGIAAGLSLLDPGFLSVSFLLTFAFFFAYHYFGGLVRRDGSRSFRGDDGHAGASLRAALTAMAGFAALPAMAGMLALTGNVPLSALAATLAGALLHGGINARAGENEPEALGEYRAFVDGLRGLLEKWNRSGDAAWREATEAYSDGNRFWASFHMALRLPSRAGGGGDRAAVLRAAGRALYKNGMGLFSEMVVDGGLSEEQSNALLAALKSNGEEMAGLLRHRTPETLSEQLDLLLLLVAINLHSTGEGGPGLWVEWDFAGPPSVHPADRGHPPLVLLTGKDRYEGGRILGSGVHDSPATGALVLDPPAGALLAGEQVSENLWELHSGDTEAVTRKAFVLFNLAEQLRYRWLEARDPEAGGARRLGGAFAALSLLSADRFPDKVALLRDLRAFSILLGNDVGPVIRTELERIGSVAHDLQDLFVPAHDVAITHAAATRLEPLKKEWYEKYAVLPNSWLGTRGGPLVYGVLMPLVEESLRAAFHLWAGWDPFLSMVVVYSLVHAVLHAFTDVADAGWAGFARRLPLRLGLSAAFGLAAWGGMEALAALGAGVAEGLPDWRAPLFGFLAHAAVNRRVEPALRRGAEWEALAGKFARTGELDEAGLADLMGRMAPVDWDRARPAPAGLEDRMEMVGRAARRLPARRGRLNRAVLAMLWGFALAGNVEAASLSERLRRDEGFRVVAVDGSVEVPALVLKALGSREAGVPVFFVARTEALATEALAAAAGETDAQAVAAPEAFIHDGLLMLAPVHQALSADTSFTGLRGGRIITPAARAPVYEGLDPGSPLREALVTFLRSLFKAFDLGPAGLADFDENARAVASHA